MPVAFAACAVCNHALPTSCRIPRCRMCGGPLVAQEAPPDLLSGWRCGCARCLAIVC